MKWLFKILERFRVLKNISSSKGTVFRFSNDVEFHLHPTSKIEINNGTCLVGFDLDPNFPHATRNKTVISLGKNSKLIFDGNTIIGRGNSIRIKDDGVLTFKGENRIDHDCDIICTNTITVGKHTLLSWNITLMDHHGHSWMGSNNKIISKKAKPLIIEDNVGLLMHTKIVSGVNVGQNSIVGPSVTIRSDIPENCMVFSNDNLKIKENIRMIPIDLPNSIVSETEKI